MNTKFGVDYYAQQHIKEFLPLIKLNDFWNKFNTPNEIFTFFKDKISFLHIYKYIKKYRPDFVLNTNISTPHKIINEFLDSLGIDYIVNTRKIILPLELDIFIPKHKLAIEINGVYYHSENKGKNKNYHLNKTEKCEEKDIELLHLTDVDILTKKDIVFNLIKEKLNLNEVINIKDCIVIDLERDTSINFIKENSLFEYKESDIHRGLIYKNELVSIITINLLNNVITSYVDKLDYIIQNGLILLTKDINKNLVLYVDRTISNKNTIEDFWLLKEITDPTYQYMNNIKLKYWNCGYKVYTNK